MVPWLVGKAGFNMIAKEKQRTVWFTNTERLFVVYSIVCSLNRRVSHLHGYDHRSLERSSDSLTII